ncbi:hypothetical protein AB1Y20_021860 [Prymnesium parvum]|uniref:Major facilitator superfamily (MFS) profile domain-containing protein n=1 Tax=Prymnesium parvum TaxID=97485 RepID=A0AB34JMH3_PRYPA|mmetsp:Transcript_21971/g.54744  ORF Transcript_21971/g.54744 Transcript_21971/m.54744 type:complete len:450 (+) Transcript_21971:29-1378(+)
MAVASRWAAAWQSRCTEGAGSILDWLMVLALSMIMALDFALSNVLSYSSGLRLLRKGVDPLSISLPAGVISYVPLVFGLLLGPIADQLHRPRLLVGAMLLWVLLTLLCGVVFANSRDDWVILPRFFLGVAEAAFVPSAVSLVSTHLPPQRFNLAVCVIFAGASAGSAFGYLMSQRLAENDCFYLLASLAAVPILLMLTARELKRPPVSWASLCSGLHHTYDISARSLCMCPSVVLVLFSTTVLGFSQIWNNFGMFWLVAERNISDSETSLGLALCDAIAGPLGAVLIGWFIDQMVCRVGFRRLSMLAWFILLLLLFQILALITPSSSRGMLWTFIVASAALKVPTAALLLSALVDLSPFNIRCTLVACTVVCFSAIGNGLGDLACEYLVQALVRADYKEPITLVNCYLVLFAAIGNFPLFIAGRRSEVDRETLRPILLHKTDGVAAPAP